jgi:hypothetical protein
MTWDNQQQPAPEWGPQPEPQKPLRDYGRRPGWTRKRFVLPGAAVLFFIGVMIGTAGSGGTTTTKTAADSKPAPAPTVTITKAPAVKAVAKPKPAPTVTVTATATKTVQAKAPKAPASGTAVPNFVGMGLQDAQDKAQANGFFLLKSHDSTGADRFQILDRDWKVCSQNVKAGTHASPDTTLDFGAVKLSETCP